MFTNFAAGHSLSNFLFDLNGFENSLYTHFLLSPGQLAVPGYVFGSISMGNHYSAAKKRGVTPLIKIGLEEELFVPFLTTHVYEQGLGAQADDLLRRDARGVSSNAKQLAADLRSFPASKTRCINRNYGEKYEELVKQRIQDAEYKEDERFQSYWQDPDVLRWREETIARAIELTKKPRDDGTHDDGLKVARVVDALAEDLGVDNEVGTQFSPQHLLEIIKKDDEKAYEKTRRFLSIMCMVFNDAVSWAMSAQSNWPIQDNDFFRFGCTSERGIDEPYESDDEWASAVTDTVLLPSIDLLRRADADTLMRIREIGNRSFFPSLRDWSKQASNGVALKEALDEYMHEARRALGSDSTAVAAFVAQYSEENKVHKYVAASFGAVSGVGVGYGLSQVIPPEVAGAAGSLAGTIAGLAANSAINSYICFGVKQRANPLNVSINRSTMDVTVLSDT